MKGESIMAEDILIVVDMQNDFVDGALGTAEAVAIVPNVIEKVKKFDGEVIFTQDTHGEDYLTTQEGRLLPVVHCIKGTEGWQLIDELDKFKEENGCLCYEKPTFGCVALAEDLATRYAEGEIGSVEFIGLCTDICVISNALMVKAHIPEVPIKLDPSCCAGVTPEKHEAAIEAMKSCQILI